MFSSDRLGVLIYDIGKRWFISNYTFVFFFEWGKSEYLRKIEFVEHLQQQQCKKTDFRELMEVMKSLKNILRSLG